MREKMKVLIGVIALLSLTIVGCSKESSTKVGEYDIKVKGSEIFEAWEGNDALKVTVDFTNNSDVETMFATTIITDAYQEDVMLDLLPSGIQGLDGLHEAVLPGDTIEVNFGFSVLDYETPVEVKIMEFLGDESETILHTIDLEELVK